MQPDYSEFVLVYLAVIGASLVRCMYCFSYF